MSTKAHQNLSLGKFEKIDCQKPKQLTFPDKKGFLGKS
jgi:hypothetical protein